MSDKFERTLGYAHGNRGIERTIAFVLALVAAVFLGLHIKFHALEGLFWGICVSYMIRIADISPVAESVLMTIILIVVGLSLGIAAFGMGIAGYFLFSVLGIILIQLFNKLFFRRQFK